MDYIPKYFSDYSSWPPPPTIHVSIMVGKSKSDDVLPTDVPLYFYFLRADVF